MHQNKLTINTSCLRSLTFINFDCDSRLVVRSCREDLRLLGRDDGIPGDEFGHHSSNSLNTKSQRAHVQKHDVSCGRDRTTLA